MVDYVDSNDLNAMVIDIKDDMGVVTADSNSKMPHQENTEEYIPDIKELMVDGRKTNLSNRRIVTSGYVVG